MDECRIAQDPKRVSVRARSSDYSTCPFSVGVFFGLQVPNDFPLRVTFADYSVAGMSGCFFV